MLNSMKDRPEDSHVSIVPSSLNCCAHTNTKHDSIKRSVSTFRTNNVKKLICARLRASAVKQMRTALFWAITQRLVVIRYRRSGTT